MTVSGSYTMLAMMLSAGQQGLPPGMTPELQPMAER